MNIRYKYRVRVPNSYDVLGWRDGNGEPTYWYDAGDNYSLKSATENYEEFRKVWAIRPRAGGNIFMEILEIQIMAVLESEWEDYNNQDHDKEA